jgi:pRiA4b ORF-3-like protein
MPYDRIVQLRIALLGIAPPIWRRLQVPGTMTLPRVHRVFQVAMGWTDSHLHEFLVQGQRYGRMSRDTAPYHAIPEGSIPLHEITFLALTRFEYRYDFGDGWQHEVEIEQELDREPGVRYPRCLGGARACPPEDSGGVGGYAELVEAMRDPRHARREDLLAWLGGPFDPEAFVLDAVNRRLLRFRA